MCQYSQDQKFAGNEMVEQVKSKKFHSAWFEDEDLRRYVWS